MVELGNEHSDRAADSRARRLTLAALAGLCGSVGMLGGCTHWDSYLDPSVVGRWERTPTRVPILERLAPIEDAEDTIIEVTEVTAEDLEVQPVQYRLGAGDVISLTVWDLFVIDQPATLSRVVDQNGYIEVPQIGRVHVAGMTEEQARQAVVDAVSNLIQNPLVSLVVESRREQTYYLMGAVAAAGPYRIPAADYRLLEALVAGGGFNENIPYLYVIRQVPLTEERGPLPAGSEIPQTRPGEPGGEPGDLLDVIDELSRPAGEAAPTPGARPRSAQAAQDAPEPLIELEPRRPSAPGVAAGGPEAPAAERRTRWLFLNGEWVQAAVPAPAPSARPSANGAAALPDALVTQRIIRIPLDPLLRGDARYNVVIRPGDVIRLPPPPFGNVYVGGQVARPGAYNLAEGLTLSRLITSAGGLSAIGIPERVDLTRMTGDNEQATIMLNLRAIAEGTMPDVYIKDNDHINVGTHFWALPLAVIRNGFRASYGFGFLLDRNFGNDVFGAPPSNRFGE